MLKKAAEDLRVATNNAASNAIQNIQIKDLCVSARECTAKGRYYYLLSIIKYKH